MPTLITRLRAGLKAFTMRWSAAWGGRSWGGGWNRAVWTSSAPPDYAAAVADGRGSSIIVGVLNWMARKFPDAPLRVKRLLPDGTEEVIPGHPLTALLRRPNPYYQGSLLLVAAVLDWMVHGNGYLLKLRNGQGRPVQLWYIPQHLIWPTWDTDTSFIDAYVYSTPSGEQRLPPADVIHFRNGIDPENVRCGLSQLKALLLELFTDQEAASYAAAVVKNTGVFGVLITPEGDTSIDPDTAAQIKAGIDERFTGTGRGTAGVIGERVKVQMIARPPSEMSVRELRNIPEERVTAIFGIPSIVVGFGSGLSRSTFSNMQEAREAAVEANLIPTYRSFAETLQLQLLPDFEANPDAFEVFFDLSELAELQEDANRLVEREVAKLRAGAITINEFRSHVGDDPLEAGGDVLLVPANQIPTPPASLAVAAEPEPAAEGPPAVPATPVEAAGLLRPELKAIGTVRAIEALRARLLPMHHAELAAMLETQRHEVTALILHLGQAAGLATWETKASYAETVTQRLEARFADQMAGVLARQHIRALVGTGQVVAETLGVPATIDEAVAARLRQEALVGVPGITQTTMGAVRTALADGQAAGESVEQLAARVRQLGVFGDGRAETIARSELAIATNAASLAAYEASGVVTHVRIHDGTHFDEPCASLNGQELTLEQAAGIPSIQHPNCSRRFEPLARPTRRGWTNGHPHLAVVVPSDLRSLE
ncbi:MAG TPA: phage portal protein [Chloroflexota bacterium]|jgi:HK97 family phage portal protein